MMTYGKPVTDVSTPSADVLAGAYRIERGGPNGREHGPMVYGCITHKRNDEHAPGGAAEVYSIELTDSADYRDNVIIPFATFYNMTLRVERFGPDIDTAGATV